jgi:hypothetical protein
LNGRRDPPRLDEKEQEEFRKYAIEYYRGMVDQAFEIAKGVGFAHPDGNMEAEAELRVVQAVFDKLASPRVYLMEEWLKARARKEAGIED